MEYREDTIAAVATPRGTGGVALVRISGPDAYAVAARVFRPRRGALCDMPARTAAFGDILFSGGKIDEGLCTLFRAPASFTGEDTAEIACHGGAYVTRRVLESALVAGARAAGPGEFTKRAFLNGKIDLAEAEGIAGILYAETAAQLTLSNAWLEGRLSAAVDGLRARLLSLAADLMVDIEYAGEDLGPGRAAVDEGVRAAREELARLAASYDAGRAVADGVDTVLLGKPNAGKSALLNAVVGFERAIVTDIPGTTRDTVSEKVALGRVTLRLSDMAGIRESGDAVERLGVARAREKAAAAELVLAVFDLSRPMEDEDREVLTLAAGKKAVCVLNKSDLAQRLDTGPVEAAFPGRCVRVSAATGEGLGALRDAVEALYFTGGEELSSGRVLASARQYAAALRAKGLLDGVTPGLPDDLAAAELARAAGELGELSGRQAGERVAADIFARFCVGK